MIVGFRDEWLRAYFVKDVHSRNIPANLESRLFRKLQIIDDATTDQDLRVPPSNHFENYAAISMVCIQSASTGNGGLSFDGMAVVARRPRSILTTIAIDEVTDADDQA